MPIVEEGLMGEDITFEKDQPRKATLAGAKFIYIYIYIYMWWEGAGCACCSPTIPFSMFRGQDGKQRNCRLVCAGV